jgi:NAD-dependent deacetylase
MSTEAIRQVAQWLSAASAPVAFTGAGISTESGIPDFRSPSGVWATSQPVYFDDFVRSAEARQEYWRQKAQAHRDFSDAQPNVAHIALARWEAELKLHGVVTQNIDGLHQLAGSRNVLELHGTARFVGCLNCKARFEADGMVSQFLSAGTPPDCPGCGGILKHATISFGQALPADVLAQAIALAEQSDVFLAIGSSLVVQPAAGLPWMARQAGARLVIINRDPTPLDDHAHLVIRASIGETLSAVDKLLR